MPTPSNVAVEVLRTLHRIHRQLTDLRDRLNRGPRLIKAHEANVAKQEAALAQAQADTKALRVATDAKQLQFKTNENKAKELRVKLNAAQSNREYQLLKEQIAADEMANSVLADEILEAMEKVDVLHAAAKEAAAIVAKGKEDLAKTTKEIQTQEPSLRADLQAKEQELQKYEADLPGDIRDAYQRVVRLRGEDALAPMRDQFCGGCNQQVTLNNYNALRLNRPVFCKSCGRLMYIPEGEKTEPMFVSDF